MQRAGKNTCKVLGLDVPHDSTSRLTKLLVCLSTKLEAPCVLKVQTSTAPEQLLSDPVINGWVV